MEGEVKHAADLRRHLSDARDDAAAWKTRYEDLEERLTAIGRSHDLLLTTVSGTSERLLRPHGSYDAAQTRPQAWQEQLYDELASVVGGPLVSQATHELREWHEQQQQQQQQQQAQAQAQQQPSSSQSPSPSRQPLQPRAATQHTVAAAGAASSSSSFAASSAASASARELRMEIGQLQAYLEQTRREKRVERSLLSGELKQVEAQWPSAAAALRKLMQPVLTEVSSLPRLAAEEAAAAADEARRASRRERFLELEDASADHLAISAELDQERLRSGALGERLAAASARADALEATAAAEAGRAKALEAEVEQSRAAVAAAQHAARESALDRLRHRVLYRASRALLPRVFSAWHDAARGSALGKWALRDCSRRLRRADVREALRRWAAAHAVEANERLMLRMIGGQFLRASVCAAFRRWRRCNEVRDALAAAVVAGRGHLGALRERQAARAVRALYTAWHVAATTERMRALRRSSAAEVPLEASRRLLEERSGGARRGGGAAAGGGGQGGGGVGGGDGAARAAGDAADGAALGGAARPAAGRARARRRDELPRRRLHLPLPLRPLALGLPLVVVVRRRRRGGGRGRGG